MTVLSIETSTSVCSAAWCIDGQCVAQRIHTEGSNHAALLPRFIDELLQEAQLHHYQADAIAVSQGPGSYTGLRIGVSTAKGLCYGWNIPLIAVPTLDVLTEACLHSYPELQGTLVPMLDARRMEVYTQVNGQVFAQIVENTDWLPQDTAIYYFGDGAAKCQSVLSEPRCHLIDQIIPTAEAVGWAVAHHDYPTIDLKQLAYYTPFYLKEFIAAPSHIKGLQ